MAAEDLRFGEHTKRGVFRWGRGEDIGEFLLEAARVQELCAVAPGFVEGSPVQVAVAEDCARQVGVLEVGVAQGAVLEEGPPHGRTGGVDAVKAGVADAGVVQAGTPERDPSQFEWCLLGSYCPAAQVRA